MDPKDWKRRYAYQRMKKLGVDVSHFEREGAEWTKEILEPAVAASTSVHEVLRRIGLDVVGGHHTNVSRRIKAYDIDTSHFTSMVRTERQRFNQRRQNPEDILTENTSAHARRVPSSRLKRAMSELGMEVRCTCAGSRGCGSGNRCPWRSITSTGTGATIDGRICGCCAPTATPSPAPGAGEAEVGKQLPVR
ncbi:HNH endonuclease [Streptomyces sp. SAS_272]|uniref:HNH endonuclease n=1 Tax=Streptomyces sp. SAS_272 TaxID=3412747 RepID=UPI00403CFC58